MSNDPHPPSPEDTALASSHTVHVLMRFLWVLRRRKVVVLTTVGIFCLLGLLVYATATRIYQSKASLLVLKTGVDLWSPTMTADRTMQDQMATYQQLCTSAVVLNDAIKRLDQLPPEVRGQTRNHWVDGLRDLLTARTMRRTSIIEIACRSKDATACVELLNALVAAYLDFIDHNHKTVAAEIVSVLEKERVDLENRITAKERLLLGAKHEGGDLGLKENSRYIHPLVQRVVQLNEVLLECQQRRVRLEASLAAIDRTVQAGGDLRQHLLGLEPLVGKEVILSALGLHGEESALAASTERQLLEDQAELKSLGEHLGPRHPRVVQLAQKVRGAQQYLASFRQRLNDRLAGISHPELGTMLMSMVQQDLAQTKTNEEQLRQEFNRAESDAIALNDRLANVTIIERDIELLRNLHAALVNRIENTDINQNQADVRVSVVSEPVTPTTPISPRFSRILLLCLGLGIGVGVLIVYVIDVLDDRFRSPEELQEQLGLPILAMVRRHPPRDEPGVRALQLYAAPNAAESEAFRTLRTALAFSADNVQRLAITSAEPADGKTTVLANLGVAYAQVGKRTLLIDGDLRRPGLTSRLDLRTESGLSDILRSDQNVGQMGLERIRPSGIDRLDVLPCGPRPPDPSELLSRERFSDLLGWAETVYDQILVDGPPILAASDVAIIGRLVDGVVVVVQPHKNRRRRVLRAIENLASLGVRLAGIVINHVTNKPQAGYSGYGEDYAYGYGYGYGYGEGYGNPPSDKQGESELAAGPDDRAEEVDRPVRPEGQIPVRRRAA